MPPPRSIHQAQLEMLEEIHHQLRRQTELLESIQEQLDDRPVSGDSCRSALKEIGATLV